MADSTAEWARLPVRQWVLSVPKRLRYYLSRDKGALNAALLIFLRLVQQSLQAHCPSADWLISTESIWHGESQVVSLWEGWQARIRGCRRSYVSTESIWHGESLVVTVWEGWQARIRGCRRSYKCRVRFKVMCSRVTARQFESHPGESQVVTLWEGWQARIRGCRRSYKCQSYL